MISWERVAELREEIGDEDFAEVAEMFLNEVDEVISRLKTDPDPKLFEQDLHFLKSSALNIGFEAFGKLCHDGEQLAASGNAAVVSLEPVFQIYEKSRAVFDAR